MNCLEILTRAILVRRPTLEKVAGTVLALGTTVGIRWTLDSALMPTPFITYYPALLLLAVFYETRYAVALMFGQLALARLLLFAPPVTTSWALLALFFVGGGAIMIVIGHFLRQSVHLLDDRARQAEAFNRELQHRTKNSLQTMRSLAAGARRAHDPDAFYEALAGRLDALAKANEILGFGALPSCDITALVEGAIKPFRLTHHDSQFELNGPHAQVDRDAVVPLAMALHELCTNAEKYGSLGIPAGRVELHWELGPAGDKGGRPLVTLRWVERGGPAVVPPTRKGLGTRLLTANKGLRAVTLRFDRDGVDCTMAVDAAPVAMARESPAAGLMAALGNWPGRRGSRRQPA